MEEIRLRLIFKEPHILSELQKSEGLEHSWFLLKPQHKTIFDLSSNILHNFQLHHSCPHGLLLSMDDFVLPPYESTCILKDKDVVSVKKKRGVLAVEGNDVRDIAERIKIVEKQPVNTGLLLLANKEFDNESGGYESEEPKEEGADPVKDRAHVENTLGCNEKKRKASETLRSSKKKKKHCSAVAEKVDELAEKFQQDMTSKKGLSKQKMVTDPVNKDVDNNNEDAEISKVNDSISSMKKDNKLQENGVENVEAIPKPDGVKKGPSRSSRRQYAKREMRKILKKIVALESEGLEANSGNKDGNLHSEGRNGETDGRPKGRRKWKQQQNKAKDQVMSDQPKGLLHWKQSREEGKGSHTNRQEKTNEKSSLCEKPDQDGNMEDDVVPVEIRPGHIRFEPLPKDQALQQDQVQAESNQCNGMPCKDKGKIWGHEKVSTSSSNVSENSNKEHPEMLNAEKTALFQEPVDFNTLPFLSGLPKEGNVIAYRLLELSSNWTAGLSSYRVGKVSQYNPEAGRVLLTPVAEYPVFSNEDTCSMHQHNSIYKEDGSLEISFSSLLEVRLVRNDTSDSVAGLSGRTSEDPATNGANPVFMTPMKKTDGPAIENGVNLWEQFSKSTKTTNGHLSEESSWGKWSSPKSSWSQRAQFSEAPWSHRASGETSWSRGSSWPRGASRGRARGRGGSQGRSGAPGRGRGRDGPRGRGRGRGPSMSFRYPYRSND